MSACQVFLSLIYLQAETSSKVMKDFFSNAQKLTDDMTEFCMKTPPPNTLKEYSVWMSKFQACDYNEQLELPGLSVFLFTTI